jgi:hypothetical protein
MFSNDMERFKGFDLQFFAEEPAPEPVEIPAEPAEEPVNEPEPEESFVDENLIPEDLKKSDAFKGMKGAYTKKTQEIAEFKTACKEAGLTPKQAANLLKEMQEDPHGLAERISPKQQKKTDPEPEPEDEELDEYDEKIVSKAEKRAVAKAKKEIMEELKPTLSTVEADRQEKAQRFLTEVDTSIDKVLKDYPDSKVTKKELFEIAKRNQILPGDMEAALVHAVGPAKYKELISKKALADQNKKIDENKKSVGPVMGGGDGVTPASYNEPAQNLNEVTERIMKKYGIT